MEQLIEQIGVYSAAFLLCLLVIFIYLRKKRNASRRVEEKILQAKHEGLYEPVSLHPVVDPARCIQTGACISACPEKDILGIRNGKATTINASRCVGHGACLVACPTHAITLFIGTEQRGVDLPHVNPDFQSNVPGIYIAGELGGMGLIKNAVEQGIQAVENIVRTRKKQHKGTYDLIVVGAGPAGIAASLQAKKHHLKCLTLEQDTLGGTVFSFPRAKVVMTSAMNLPLYGKIKLNETSKQELLGLWQDAISKNEIEIKENTKVESISCEEEYFNVETSHGDTFTASHVLLAIGRRGSPRKLGIPGENLEKVSYRLLEPELISGKDIMVVGGGDAAIESALLLAEHNGVTLSYRGETFSRIKPKNSERITKAVARDLVLLRFNTNLVAIENDRVLLSSGNNTDPAIVKNDLVYIFIGGELPTQFLSKAGISITTKFGEAIVRPR
ncbi:MAG: NAD(P)-binding domain-containing protein [Bacteroidetes bacterium]|nr:NAD(P)-binding domain-containing protein [Bacteroidota bacterium]